MLTTKQVSSLNHIGYEWWMFRAAHDLLQRLPEDHDPVRNALIESLAIHGRGLLYFFHVQPSYPTDWSVKDFGLAISPLPKELDSWREDANQRVAHLTDRRLSPLQAWNVSQVRTLLGQQIESLRLHVGPDMPGSWSGDLNTSSALLNRGQRSSAPQQVISLGPTGLASPTL